MSDPQSPSMTSSPAVRSIRAIAIAVIRRGDDILVFEGFDRVKNESFFRPLGGGIEPGELGAEAVARELREEIGAEIANARRVGVLENRFVLDGERRHEIVLVYTADLVDESVRARDRIVGHEDNGAEIVVRWMPLASFRAAGAPPLYPDGILGLIDETPRDR